MWFFIFKSLCIWFLGGTKVWVQNWDFGKVFIDKDFDKLCMQFGDKF